MKSGEREMVGKFLKMVGKSLENLRNCQESGWKIARKLLGKWLENLRNC